MEYFLKILSMLGTLILITLIFVAAYYVSKIAAKKYQNSMPNIEEGIEIIDRKIISKDQALMIIKSGGKAYLIGTTDSSINLIDELDPLLYESVDYKDSNIVSEINFKGMLKNTLNNLRKDKGQNDEEYK